MNIVRSEGAWNAEGRKVYAAIGVFDGVHLGHQRILQQIIAAARENQGLSAVVTFDCHPSQIVAPERTPPLLYPLPKRLREFETMGMDVVRLIHFDKPFSQILADQFVRNLAADSRCLESICVGAGFTFGHRRQGTVELLRQMGMKLNFTVQAADDVKLEGETVSSTRVRQAVREGNFGLAGRMLGRPYTLNGSVVRGAQLGRKLGFPTANMDVAGIVTPPNGVYAADATVNGATWRGAVNIGYRPTVETGSASLHVEAHLLDFSEDIYGQELELMFLQKLRDEQKFPSLASLREQVTRDIAQARNADKV